MVARTLICVSLLFLFVPCRAVCAPKSGDSLGPKVKVIRLKFQTPVPLTPPERQKLIASLRVVGWKFGQEQTSEFTKDTAEELAREAYQDKGYFKAEVAAELISIRAQDSNAVAVILQVTPGRQYHLASLSWRGMSAFSESELEKLIPTQVGEVFNRTKIASGLETVKKLYDSRGYINFTSVPTPQVDDAEGTVSFEIDIDEGGQFHFGKLDVEGMQEAHRRILLSAWEGLHGKPYNEEKANRFFERFFRSPLPNITPEDYTTHNIDEHSRSVNYSLQLLPSLRYR